ncbi:MAG: DEAD/DEAH box helicase [Magnetococcales bacterium]|nr:DEAD/DEAH box helicase [Magnetococcales bacterium]
MRFQDLAIPEPVMEGVRACGFTECTPIQEITLPLTLAGNDVAGQAQTGTGKTAAFLIATFSHLLQPPRHKQHKSGKSGDPEFSSSSAPRALIIAPTRELAVQIDNDARSLGGHLGLEIATVYGGVDYEKQRAMLTDGKVDLLIGTPGRLIDYFKQKTYRVSAVEVLVIDEADRMFDMGFIDDLRYLLRRLPPFDQRLSMLFSATLSYRAQELSYEYMDNPSVISTKMDVRSVSQVTQRIFHVERRTKISLLVGLLRRDLTDDVGEACGRAMIFVNTKRMGERLQEWLKSNGITAGYLSGDVPQTKRLHTLQRFQDGALPVLIATDVAGRGLHIDGVTHVINFDLPENPEDYVHRIGRTARAGAKGDAISLVDEDGVYNLEAILAYLGMEITAEHPPDNLFVRLTAPPHSERVAPPDRGRTTGRTSRPRRSGEERRNEPPPASEAAPEASVTEAAPSAAPARQRSRRRKEATPTATPATEAAPAEDAPSAVPARRRRRRRNKAES